MRVQGVLRHREFRAPQTWPDASGAPDLECQTNMSKDLYLDVSADLDSLENYESTMKDICWTLSLRVKADCAKGNICLL